MERNLSGSCFDSRFLLTDSTSAECCTNLPSTSTKTKRSLLTSKMKVLLLVVIAAMLLSQLSPVFSQVDVAAAPSAVQ
jgi:hypothetical protein